MPFLTLNIVNYLA